MQAPPRHSDRWSTALVALLLALGFYLPTSLAETISVKLYLLSAGLLFSILVMMLLRKRGVLSAGAVVNVAAIHCIVLICTLFSPLTEFAYGGYIPIALLSTLFCVSIKDIELTPAARRLFDVANAINITLALLLTIQAPAVTDFFLRYYAYGYEELLPYMLEEGKPVLTFGSHSLAGFFFYLLFYLTLQTFIRLRSKLNLVYALCYLVLLISLSSFTALIFAAIASVQLFLSIRWNRSTPAALLTTAALAIALVIWFPQLPGFSEFREDVIEVLGRQENGLLGRYSSTGGLSANLEYIVDHPFSPIGLGMSWQLWYADSGPVEYVLKGSFPLLLTVYTGAYLFFRKNLVSTRRSLFLFLVFLSFELGYSNLQYLRTQYFLPFLVVYLNGLDASPEASHA